jgi:hypothetical protein
VSVAAGYPKCPRCHTELPQTLPGEMRKRAPTGMGAGGTSMGPGPERTLIYIGIAAIALIGVVTWLLVGGGGSSKPAAAASGSDDGGVEDTTDTDTGDTGDTGQETPPDRAPVTPKPPPDQTEPAADPGAVAAELGRELRAERLWATVTASGSVVVIDSSFCDDAGLDSIVSSNAAALRAAQLTTVRCRAPHGGVVFERGL